MNDRRKRILVTGIGVVSSYGPGNDIFFDGIFGGRSAIDYVTKFDTSQFDVKIGGEIKDFDPTPFIDKRDARRMDLFCQYGIVASNLCLLDAGVKPSDLDRDRVGIYIGSGIGGLSTLFDEIVAYSQKGPKGVSPFFIPKAISNMASGVAAINLGFRGPNMTVVTACATGNHAIGEALCALKRGEADVILAGGTEAALIPIGMAGFSSMKALSTSNNFPQKASRPFDAKRDGFVMGEGAAVLLLETMENALAHGAKVYCEVIGYGQSADAYHLTAPAPGGEGAVLAMRGAIRYAGIEADQVGYVNAHGTSTPYNDKFETEAIKRVFGDHAYKLKVSSTKSMIGHLLGAAGAAEAAICAYSLNHQKVPPTINYEYPDPDCDLDYVPNVAQDYSFDYAMSNAFGFGGQNAVLLFKRFLS